MNRLPTFKKLTFPAGEKHLILENQGEEATVSGFTDLIEIGMAQELLQRHYVGGIKLALPYVPYGRQDRATTKKDAFSLRTYCSLLNSLNFDRVTIVDPHSDVTTALINWVRVINQVDIINLFEAFRQRILQGNIYLCSPDAGSNKKTMEVAKYFDHNRFIRADKIRDVSTGQIKETIVYGDVEGYDVCIVDDICDGGATFIALAKGLKTKGAKKVILYVTHGIFSKGTEHLLSQGIDEIYTTNSFEQKDGTTVFDVYSLI